MATSAVSRLPKRLASGVTALALVTAGVFAVAVPSAEAGSGATVTASPTSTTTGVVTNESFTIQNTKTAITTFTIQGPPGLLSVRPVSTSNGWTNANPSPVSTLVPCGTGQQCVLLTYTPSGSKYGNGANGSVTATISFTALTTGSLGFVITGNGSSAGSQPLPPTTVGITVTGTTVAPTVTAALTGSPSSVTAGTTVNGTVKVTDVYGSPVAISSSSLSVSNLTCGGSTTCPSLTGPSFSGSGNQVGFSFRDTKAETVSFKVAYGSILSNAVGTTFTPGPAASLSVAFSTASLGGTTPTFTAGTTVQGTATLTDSFSNPVTITQAVTFSNLSCSSGSCSGVTGPTFAAGVGNVATFTLKDTKAETVSFNAVYGVVTSSTVTAAFVAGAAGQLSVVLAAPPTPNGYPAGSNVTGTVTLTDGNGNPVPIVFGTLAYDMFSVTCSVSSPCPVTPKFSNYSGNTATVSFSDTKAETVSFDVVYGTAVRTKVTAAISSSVAKTVIVDNLLTPPSTGYVAGSTVTGTVSLTDAYGNAVSISDPAHQLTASAIPSTANVAFDTDPGTGKPRVSFSDTAAETLSFTVTYSDGTTTSDPSSPVSAAFVAGKLASLHMKDLLDNTGKSFYTGDSLQLDFTGLDIYGNAVGVDGAAVTVNSNTTGAFVPTGSAAGQVLGYFKFPDSITASQDVKLTLTLTGTAIVSDNWLLQTFTKQEVSGSGDFVPGVAGGLFTPNLSGSTCATLNSCGSVDLPNGGNGPVTMGVTGNNLTITGNLKEPGGTTPLYPLNAPMKVTYVCTQTDCPIDLMPNDNGVTQGTGQVGAACQNGGTVFLYTRNNTPYCMYNSPKQSVQFAQSYDFYDQLSTESSPNLVRNACQIDLSSGNALALNQLDAGTVYPEASTIPAKGFDGNPIHSCIDVASITVNMTQAVAGSPQYFISYTILASDDYQVGR